MSKWIVTSIDKQGRYKSYVATFGHDLPAENELKEMYIDKDEAIIFMQKLEDFSWLK